MSVVFKERLSLDTMLQWRYVSSILKISNITSVKLNLRNSFSGISVELSQQHQICDVAQVRRRLDTRESSSGNYRDSDHFISEYMNEDSAFSISIRSKK